MALSVTNSLTIWDEMDVDNSVLGILDVDFFYTGTGCIGVDCDIETQDLFNGDLAAVDMSGGMHLYLALLCMTQPTLDTKANGGMGILVKDSSGNISGWYVAGKDTYPGGWEVFTCYTGNTPDYVPGSATNMADIVAIGAHFKCLAKSKLTANCFMDRAVYGNTPVLKITGTNTTTYVGWPEVLSVADASDSTKGYMKAQTASYILKGPVQFGDDSGTLSTNFSDDFNEVVFGVQPVSATHYGIVGKGNATGSTFIILQNQIMKSAGERFSLDLSDQYITTGYLANSIIAKAGLSYFKAGQDVLNNVFNNCSQIDPSTATFQGNTISNSVDAGGALLWPTAGNVSACQFINCNKAIEITQTTDQSFVDLVFDDVTGKYDVHKNNGTTSISVAKTGTSNPNSYITTGSGTVTFTSSINLTIDAPVSLVGAEIRIYDLDDTPAGSLGTELAGTESHTAATYSYTGNGGNLIWIQIMKDGYVEFGQAVTMPSSDGSFTALLKVDLNA